MSQNKYVMLAANSSLKGKSDFNKFHKAMQLKGCIDKVRRDYQRHLDSSDRQLKQQATTMWLIDVLALRVGGEKNEDETEGDLRLSWRETRRKQEERNNETRIKQEKNLQITNAF